MARATPEQAAAAFYSARLHSPLGSFLNKVNDIMAYSFLSQEKRNLIEQKILARRGLRIGTRSACPKELTVRPQR